MPVCPICGYPLDYRDDLITIEGNSAKIPASCSFCEARFNLTFDYKRYEICGYGWD